jgi:predicted sulfurtransferase
VARDARAAGRVLLRARISRGTLLLAYEGINGTVAGAHCRDPLN